MNGPELRELLSGAMAELEMTREELRALDAAIGDGDLGITVADGAKAVAAGLEELDGLARPADVFRTAAQKFAAANPSTMAALVTSGLLAVAKTVGDAGDVDREMALSMGEAAFDAIAKRGKAALGDKTVLDALAPSLEALHGAPAGAAEALDTMIEAAGKAVAATASLRGRRGRSAWVGERGVGHPDGGATAYLRLLQALRTRWPIAKDKEDR